MTLFRKCFVLWPAFLCACSCSLHGKPVDNDNDDIDVAPHPTYDANAANWKQGTPTAVLDVSLEGMKAVVSGHGTDPGGISACSYSFGDESPSLMVSADEEGACESVEHTYSSPGSYDIVLAVWDDMGMIGKDYTTVHVGDLPGISERSEAFIGDCLETYWWTPDEGGPFPSMVHYTPYPIADDHPPTAFLTSGIAAVLVTNRGQGASCDAADLFGPTAQQDLLLIDQWLENQSWSNGDFCLWGHSGPGILGALSSSVAPPGLRCAFVGGGAARMFEGLVSKSGAWWPIATGWILGTYGHAALQDLNNRNPPLVDHIVKSHRNARATDFFSERDKVEELRNLDIPILFHTAWDDLAWGGGSFGGPYLEFVQDMQSSTSGLLIFPGVHAYFDPTNERPFVVPTEMSASDRPSGGSFIPEVRGFLFHHLLDGPAPPSKNFNYRYLRLKGGVQAAWMNRQFGGWQSSDRWPPEATSVVKLYLRSEPSGTVDSRHDGSLFGESAEEERISFDYAPPPAWDPVYSSDSSPWRHYTFPDMRRMDLSGITFTSPPLRKDAIVEGPATLTFTAETELYDFDWMVILSDIWPDGSSHRVSSGFLRASLRNDDVSPAAVEGSGFTGYGVIR